MDLRDQVDKNIQSRRLIGRQERIVVAVSGGVDSMVLLHLLHQSARTSRWELVVAHLNHRLRGRSSAADARFVARAAERLSIPCVIQSASVQAQARQLGISVEMAARQLRHEFLASVAMQHGCSKIALAHHADDQIEWFFLRLLRGTGRRALAGMQWRNSSPADPRIQLVRPLLDQEKLELLDYARTHRVRFRHDATNDGPDILRNRIRHELLPSLRRRYQPNLNRVVLRQMEILREENECLAEIARREMDRHVRRPFGEWPVALQRLCLQFELESLSVSWSFDLIESLRLQAGHPVMIRPNLCVARDGHGRVVARSPAQTSFLPNQLEVTLDGDGAEVPFDGRVFQWTIRTRQGGSLPEHQSLTEWFDAERVGNQILLRHWRPGDRFQPIGLPRSAKLQNLFTNAKVSSSERRHRVLACAENGAIWWVEGMRIAEPFKVRPQTRRLLRWSWRLAPEPAS